MMRFLFTVAACSVLVTTSAEEWKASLKLPFAADAKIDRASFDIKKKFDLSTTDEVHITLSVDRPEAVGSASLYFHSGNGWYAMSGSAKQSSGRQTLVFPLSARRTEDKPGGLDEIDQLRLSFWRGKNVDATVELEGWNLVSYPIVVVNPDNTKADPTAKMIANQLRTLIAADGIEVGSLEQPTLTAATLKDRRIVILPLNSGFTEEQIALLKQFVESGGKLIAFYHLPAELMKSLGFGSGRYVRPTEGAQTFAEVRFEPWFVKEFGEGTPTAFEQSSWNITSAKPLTGPNSFSAKTAAVWFNGSGQPTEHAALLVSDRGAFFSHILTGDDRDKKRDFVLSLIAKWHSDLWSEMMNKRLDNLHAVGETPFETEQEKTARIAKIEQKIKPYKDAGDARRFCLDFSTLRKELAKDYIRSLPSVPGELRLWWEHAGTGAYPGDWDRTMKELKENGFNAVIPNMLWGGLAHYDSKLLPRSQQFEEHGDQIEQAVRAGKKHGVQVHVWKVNYNCSRSPKEFIDAMRQAGRTQVRFDGEDSGRVWLCPSHPENRKLECDSMVEVAKNYDVDGIHFDYIRYPDSQHCYCNGCKERFESRVGATIADWPRATRSEQWKEKFDDWRRDQITALVADVHREAKKVKPSIKISAAVFPSYPSCRSSQLQDWPVWVEKGYLDFLCPMNYTPTPATFDAYIANQLKLVAGKIPVYPGIGATAMGISMTPDQIATQIMIARKNGTPGFTIFNLSRSTIERIPPALRLGPTKP